MFSRDSWLEIISTMVANPLRTILTGVSVGVGIFILVVLLALGRGLQTGAEASMTDDAMNSMWVRSGNTVKAYGGYQANRRIQFKDGDRIEVEDTYQEIPASTARVSLWGETIRWKGEQSNFSVRSVNPIHQEIEKTELSTGRYINDRDVEDVRKVAVIGGTIVDELFKQEEPIGELIEIRGVMFKVVGTFRDPNSRWENRQIYIPLSTGQKLFRGGSDNIDMFVVSTGDLHYDATVPVEEGIDQLLRSQYRVHPEDSRGVRINNMNEQGQTFRNVFIGIKVFVIFIGFCTLIAGIIGVANIMSIVVKERTREIGVRKALGATPASVVGLILQESIFLTLVSGCIGFMVGVGLMEVVAKFADHDFFKDPRVDFTACLIAIGMLVFAGALSGIVPSVRAASIRPIEALRDE